MPSFGYIKMGSKNKLSNVVEISSDEKEEC